MSKKSFKDNINPALQFIDKETPKEDNKPLLDNDNKAIHLKAINQPSLYRNKKPKGTAISTTKCCRGGKEIS